MKKRVNSYGGDGHPAPLSGALIACFLEEGGILAEIGISSDTPVSALSPGGCEVYSIRPGDGCLDYLRSALERGGRIDVMRIGAPALGILFSEEMKRIIDAAGKMKLFIELDENGSGGARIPPGELLPALVNVLDLDVYFLDDPGRRIFRVTEEAEEWGARLARMSSARLLCARRGSLVFSYFISHSVLKGGAERCLLELIKGLVKRDVLCHVLLRSKGPLLDELERLPVSCSVLPLPWWTLAPGETADEVRRRVLTSAMEVVDDVRTSGAHIVYTNTSVVCQGAVASTVLGLPHVWHVHEFGEEDHDLRFIVDAGERARFICGSSDRVIFNSGAVMDYYVKRSGSPCNAELIYYSFADVGVRSRPRRAPGQQRHFRRAESLKILFLGAIVPKKAPEDAVRAAGELVRRGRDVELLLVGMPFRKWYQEHLQRVIRDKGLLDRVSMTGYMDDPSAVLDEADLLVVCSRMEAFGRVTVEAMLHGKPVVATRSGGSPEIVTPGCNGMLYEPGDYRGLADNLETFCRNRSLLGEYGRNARDFASRTFTEENYAGKIRNIVFELAGKKNGSQPRDGVAGMMLEVLRAEVREKRESDGKLVQIIERLGAAGGAGGKTQGLPVRTEHLLDELEGKLERILSGLKEGEEKLAEWKRYAARLRREKEEVFLTKRWRIGSLLSAAFRIATFRKPKDLPIMTTPEAPEEEGVSGAGPAGGMIPSEAARRRSEIVSFQKRSLRPRDWPDDAPLVSIIMLNFNGEQHLKRCIPAIIRNTIYPNYELVVVDNGSEDGSVEYLESMRRRMHLRIVRNRADAGYAAASNRGIEAASGQYVLFLNNDTEPLEGWLGEMISCMERHPGTGAVGSKLIYPFRPGLDNQGDAPEPDFTIQHMGVRFRRERDFIRPYHVGKGLDPADPRACAEARVPAVTGACMLTTREVLGKTGLFDENYRFGFEDIELCLRIRKAGYGIYYCPSSALFHHEFGTQNVHGLEWKARNREHNARLLREKWFRVLDADIWWEKLEGRPFLCEDTLQVGIVPGGESSAGGKRALELADALRKRGVGVRILHRGDEGWDLDVFISVAPTDDAAINNLPPHAVGIGWVLDNTGAWMNADRLSRYDVFVTDSPSAADLLRAAARKYAVVVPGNDLASGGASAFFEILRANLERQRICIKLPAPSWEGVETWGDYHVAVSLKKYLERMGHRTMIQVAEEWSDPVDVNYHVALVLRGIRGCRPKPYHFNVMWNLSHPKSIPDEEYERYDLVFVASEKHALRLAERLEVQVETLLQCTDPEIFYTDRRDEEETELVFVGNSRMVFRRILKNLLPTEHELAVYGDAWDGIIDDGFIRARYWPYERLRILYSSAKIVLNDHWDDMRAYGFVSNRVYDALAAGAFVISDRMPEIERYFEGAVVTYSDARDLSEKIDYYLAHPAERRKLADAGRRIVLERDTYARRARKIVKCFPSVERIAEGRKRSGSGTKRDCESH